MARAESGRGWILAILAVVADYSDGEVAGIKFGKLRRARRVTLRRVGWTAISCLWDSLPAEILISDERGHLQWVSKAVLERCLTEELERLAEGGRLAQAMLWLRYWLCELWNDSYDAIAIALNYVLATAVKAVVAKRTIQEGF